MANDEELNETVTVELTKGEIETLIAGLNSLCSAKRLENLPTYNEEDLFEKLNKAIGGEE